MRLRRIARYCKGCGQRMRRHIATPEGERDEGYDQSTGSRPTDWWWACRYRFFPWDDLQHHRPGSRRIRESGARARLAALRATREELP